VALTETNIVAQTRTWLGGQIRSRVVGEDVGAKSAAIFDAPGPRLVPMDSPMREVHADASMFIGGLRALLLQSLHPLAMAGVAQHSDYRDAPWHRLQRTAEFIAATTYGSVEVAERSIAGVRRIHERVVGVTADGQAYAAGDPHLLGWVHVAEVDSFLTAHRRFGTQPLAPAAADAYVRDMAIVAVRLGVIDPPTDVAGLHAELRRYRPELRATPEARRAARFLLLEPPLPLAVRPAYLTLAAAAVSLLPAWARWPLRLPYLPISERLVARPVGSAATQLIRWSTARPAPTG